MIDLENYLNCKDCRIKNECDIFRTLKENYCMTSTLSYTEYKKEKENQVTIDKEEYLKLKENCPKEHQLIVSKKEYAQLLKSAEILSALEYFDVKHWKYYKEAIDMLNDWNSKGMEEEDKEEEEDEKWF
jgi:hypothetical protein